MWWKTSHIRQKRETKGRAGTACTRDLGVALRSFCITPPSELLRLVSGGAQPLGPAEPLASSASATSPPARLGLCCSGLGVTFPAGGTSCPSGCFWGSKRCASGRDSPCMWDAGRSFAQELGTVPRAVLRSGSFSFSKTSAGSSVAKMGHLQSEGTQRRCRFGRQQMLLLLDPSVQDSVSMSLQRSLQSVSVDWPPSSVSPGLAGRPASSGGAWAASCKEGQAVPQREQGLDLCLSCWPYGCRGNKPI